MDFRLFSSQLRHAHARSDANNVITRLDESPLGMSDWQSLRKRALWERKQLLLRRRHRKVMLLLGIFAEVVDGTRESDRIYQRWS